MYDKIKIGDKINFLTCISQPIKEITIGGTGKKNTVWKANFRCECGTERLIRCDAVFKESTKSCGCYNRKMASERCGKLKRKYSNLDLIKHPLHNSYHSMKTRCYNPTYLGYLGGEIKVCQEWLDNYEVFYNWGIGEWNENSVLSRIDESKDFYPENCCFRTKQEVILGNINLEKARETCLEKYGVDHYTKTDEYKDRVKKTNVEKYGYEYCTQVPKFKQKMRDTCLEIYGFEYCSQSKEVQEKFRKTCLERFGANSPSENPEIKQKQIATTIAKYGVPYYGKTTNKQQNTVRDYVEKLTSKKFNSDWKILDGKEIDIYNEELKFGIEYCGLRWHCEKPRKYHYDKFAKCKEKEVRLITLFSDEWLTRQSQVKSFLSASLGHFEKRLYARKCTVKIIDKKTGFNFVEANHIQGGITKSTVYFGLFHEDELVGVMSFGPHHRQGHLELVLDRLSFLPYIQIVGGAAKLLKVGTVWAKEKGFTAIISWSDNRISNGNVYEKMGFVNDGELNPDYSYVNKSDPQCRIGKQSMTKKKLKCGENQTEKERAEELGFYQIWDCGKIRWKLTL